ncbi:MAG: phosphotransferase [Brevefilum sp.]|nr:phosphotransferase [Brevefilum sp.]
MSEQDAYWHEQIHRVMPELEIAEYELHQEGLVNDVLIVNNEWVIRFTKTEWGKELMANEDRLMRFLQPRLSLSIPTPVKRADGVIVYPHLIGETLLRQTWQGAGEAVIQTLADQLGQFLHELHSIDEEDLDWEVPHSFAPTTRETWLEIHGRVVDKVYPLLLPHQIDWVEALFLPALSAPDFFNHDQVLVHGDLAPYHILFHPEQKRITAVIDFGVAGLGDPAADIGSLLNYYGESLVTRLGNTYPNMQSLLTRARFYAHAIELQWVVLGIESGEHYWFTSHLGGARDIWGRG